MAIFSHDTWENIEDKKNGIPISRYLASFLNEELTREQHVKLRAWLETLELDPEDIRSIRWMSQSGKRELEDNYHRFSRLCEIKYTYKTKD